ncbi:flagellar filament capping protein FliD [Paenibacillus filicis]|uniref:Flagellar hook-associated protein 2 n=1 Tax=Paenibacillus filicis TaxID=669464 RepID=A0ABU9DS90_9BACL
MVQRITGMSNSGIDIDAAVKGMLMGQQNKVDKLGQKKQTIEWQRQAYLDMNTKLTDFRNNKLFNFKLEGTLAASKVDISGNQDAISVKATGNAIQGNLNVKVKSLATSASLTSSASVTIDLTKKSLKEQFGNVSISDSITINGKKVTFDPEKDTLDKVITKINKETNVTAFFNTSNKQLVLTSKDTGADTKIEVDMNGELAQALKLQATAGVNYKTGQDAQVFINDTLTSQKSNTFLVNGVEITLKNPSPNPGNSGSNNASDYTGSVIRVSRDVNAIVDSIKTFITDYNSILKTLQDKVSETKYRDFPPLTAEQKESLKEKEIEQWEEKAKSGLLANDSILTSVISGFRSVMSGKVDNGSKYNTLANIGIGSIGYLDNGKLTLNDENKLRKALEEDPEAVLNLFTADGTGKKDRSDMGLAERMYADLKSTLDQVKKKTGLSAISLDDTVLGKQMKDLTSRIKAGNNRLADLETRYYKQFSAMEQAMQKYNSQSNSLAGYFK